MSGHKGLAKWFKQDWVDIGSKKKGGGFAKCGRSKLKADRKRKYPKCVPAAKAAKMTNIIVGYGYSDLNLRELQQIADHFITKAIFLKVIIPQKNQ